jgi:hypothetical protein
VIFPWLQKKCPIENDTDSERSEKLQVMAMTSTASPFFVSPEESSASSQVENPFLDFSTEYTSSTPDSDKSYDPSETAPREHVTPDQLSDAAQPSDQSSSSFECDTCHTTYHSQGQLK